MKGKFDFKNINIILLIKIALGSCFAILLADRLGLSYSASAGIITLLSIQNTKRETLLITGKRFLSFLLSVAIAFGVFMLLGYHAFSFGVFLLIFVGASYLLKLEVGISMNAVLVTHFLIEKSMSYSWFINELSLFTIGAGIGIILNLYIPKNILAIRRDQAKIEEDIKSILSNVSITLLEENKVIAVDEYFPPLLLHINESLARAYDNMNNTLLSDTRYYIQYMQMRKSQSIVLKRIYTYLATIKSVPSQAHIIADFIRHIEASFHEFNNAINLLTKLEEIKLEFKSDPLPVNREEFEDRAILFYILNELEAFLLIKKEFVMSLTDAQRKKYWKRK